MSNKTSGLGDNLYLGGYDLSGDVGSVDQLQVPVATFDVTSIKSSAMERIYGRRDGNLSFTSFWEFSGAVSTPSFPATTVPQVSTYPFPVLVTIAAGTVTNVTVNGSTVGSGDGSYLLPALGSITVTYTGSPTWTWTATGAEHDILSTLPRANTVACYLRGTTVLNPTFSLVGKQIDYDTTRDASGNLTNKVQIQANSFGGEWGKQVTAGLRTDTVATTGAFVDDNGAGTAFGGQAYFQLVAFAGTSVTIDVQSATASGGSYTTTGLTTTAMTTVGAQRVATANTATINRYLKVVTTGTFAVAFTRNQVAGVVF